LLGLAAGDAVGVTLEFCSRGSAVLTDMVGGGAFGLLPGQWTDDTAMALCLGTSLLEKGGFDAEDQMQRYVRWWETGYLSSTGTCFDIGSTVELALRTYIDTGEAYAGPSGKRSAGNGSIMRLAPVPMFYYPDEEAAVRYSAESSRTTHGAEESVDACRLFGGMLYRALAGRAKEEVLFGDGGFRGAEKIAALARGAYRDLDVDTIAGTGYVVKSLEAALWCFFHTHTFADAVLKAANLGDDADTTAAVCGQLAGAFYGIEGIPAKWRERVARRDEIIGLADRLFAARPPAS
jgi:ADP-ribosyl-[dinitrogen reductase] hydrolase